MSAQKTTQLPAEPTATAVSPALRHHDSLFGLDPARLSSILTMIFWPLAIMSFINKVVIVPSTKSVTDDFTTVLNAVHRFIDGLPLYDQDYTSVHPHYLYSPGATLLLSPLGYLSNFDLTRATYIGLNGMATVAALAVLTRLFGYRLAGPTWPIAITLLFATESVNNTLLFTNINGILFFAEVLFLVGVIHNRQILAGVAIGLAITIKPQFLPLLFLPFMRRQWTTIITAFTIPVAANLAAYPLTTAPGDYLRKLIPYLGIVRDYANSSIAGIGIYFDWSRPNILFYRLLAIALVAIAVAALLRWRDRDTLMWATTTASLLLLGVFLISSLGQMYYSMLLVPVLFTVLRPRSVMHNPIAALGVYMCMSLDSWYSHAWPWFGYTFENVRGTIGWMLLLVAISITALGWWVTDVRRNKQPLLGDLSTNGLLYQPTETTTPLRPASASS